jgi:hypothetical protein
MVMAEPVKQISTLGNTVTQTVQQSIQAKEFLVDSQSSFPKNIPELQYEVTIFNDVTAS